MSLEPLLGRDWSSKHTGVFVKCNRQLSLLAHLPCQRRLARGCQMIPGHAGIQHDKVWILGK